MTTGVQSHPLLQRARARNQKARILLVEGWDPRVKEAQKILLEEGFVNTHIFPSAAATGVPPATINKIVQKLLERRSAKGLSEGDAKQVAVSPLFTAAGLLALGETDVVVSGAVHSTADVIKAGLWLLDKTSERGLISSSFLMYLSDGRIVTYADCGVIPSPTSEQLVEIAASAATTHERLAGTDPVIAFLSFSTFGSAQHERIAVVQSAVKLFHKQYPQRLADGELQFDAAWVPEIAARKAPQSKVAGKANVFVFPNLDAANIAYKITERLAGAQAIGPLLQGYAKPFLDLSRGCSSTDIVLSACCGVLLQ